MIFIHQTKASNTQTLSLTHPQTLSLPLSLTHTLKMDEKLNTQEDEDEREKTLASITNSKLRVYVRLAPSFLLLTVRIS